MKKQYVQAVTGISGFGAQHVMSGSNKSKSTAVSNTAVGGISGGAPQRVGRAYY